MGDKTTTFSMKSEILSSKDFSQDDRFMHVKLSLCTQNQKANGMHFGKEILESKMSEIDFMPIVGAIKIVEKDDGSIKYTLGSHEVELDIVDNELVYKKNTIVLGVALPNTAKFETIARHDEVTEYITFEAILFQEKYPQLKSVIDLETDASMELDKVEAEYDEDSGWYEVKNFRYLAHCLIGVPPAFKLAGVVSQFSLEDFKLEFSDVLEEIKSSLDKFNKNEKEGGNETMEDEVKVDKVDETTVENQEVDGDTTNIESEEVEGDSEDDELENSNDDSSQTNEEEFAQDTNMPNFELSHDDIRSSIWNQLNPIGGDGYREWNYWLMEVFDTYFVCQSEDESNTYYRFNFTKDQETETVNVDMDSKVEVFVMYLTKEEKDSLSQKDGEYEEIKAKYEEIQSQFDDVNGKYLEKIKKEDDAKKQEIIDSYADSLTEDEMKCVTESIEAFSVEDVDIRLAAILGKKAKVQKEKQIFTNLDTNFSGNSKWEKWLKKMN